MGTDIYQVSISVGAVTKNKKVYHGTTKIGWVSGDGDMYLHGGHVCWLSRGVYVLDEGGYRRGRVDSQGIVYKGPVRVGYIEPTVDRYFLAGAALLLIFFLPPAPADS
jgi:hypothetical protein